ncbi:TonB-dependent receptor plug domain-containing protein [Altererythrobacter soli]|uniref:TonB-dependent receptor plug domain-containing protein n=1 Tax=Croceibacterium soli TaxID=1739690 RepID=A0A6I4UTJ7_9SPHN|nr:TonB-dependent receptor plug domain-containing protein [Croceibacterium soli]MXP41806.1 TonB-dependent receptor plug domain-containing protein [Croceibacterium soli]
MSIRSNLLVAAASLAIATPTLAQDGSGTRPADGATPIVVTAARTQLPATALPMATDVIDAEALERQVQISGSTVDAVSALLPSFSPTREKLSGAGESLRGRSPLYAINGIAQSTPVRDGSRDGYTIDPFFIDRVEVIYGSNALQGIGGTGGVVNQVTVGAPARDGVSVRTLLQGTVAQGFDGEALGGKAGALVGYRAGAFDISVGGTFERRGAFLDGHENRIGVDGTQGEVQDSDSWSVFGRFGYQLSGSARLEVVANRFELEGNGNYELVRGNRTLGIPASSRPGRQPGDLPSNRAELLSASLVDDDLAGGTLNAQAFFSRTNDVFGGGTFATFQDPAIDPTGALFDQSANRSRKIGGKLSYEREVLSDLFLTGGFDALYDRTKQSLVQTDRDWVPQTDFRSLAPFAQANLGLLNGVVRLAGGARWENVQLKVRDYETLAFYGATNPANVATYKPVFVSGGSPSFDKLLLNGGIVIEPMKGLRAYGSYAEGYTIADVGRILRAIEDEGVDIDDYIALEPVISNNRELGLEWDRGPISASAGYFWSSSDLGSLLVEGADGIFSVAREPIEIEGLEASLAWRTPLPGLTLSGGYAQVEGQTDSNDADELVNNDLDGANISPDRANFAADFTRGPLSARVQARMYLERSFNDADTRTDFEGYTLFDAYLALRTGLGEFALAAQNLTDEYYITYNSDTVRITDNDRFFAGRGRTVTLSWRGAF